MKTEEKSEAATGATVTASEPENVASQAESQEPNNPDSTPVEIKPEEPATDAAEPPVGGSEPAGATESAGVTEPLPYLAQHFSLMPTGDLTPHPQNKTIYGEEVEAEFVDAVKRNGVYQPLLVTSKNVIISGHRRWLAAKEAGITEVPVVVFHSDNELDILAALVEANKQREKTNEQIVREFKVLDEVEEKRAKMRMATRKQGQPVENVTQPKEKGKARDIAAAKVGISGVTAEQGEAVVDAIDKLDSKGKKKKADELRQALSRSFSGAYKKAVADGLIKSKKQRPPKAPRAVEGEDAASDAAMAAADSVLTFIRGRKPATLTPQRQRDWKKVLTPVVEWHASLPA